MPFTVTMPKLSPTMEEGSIAKWWKKEGDFVKAGEVLFEVATDKATLEQTALDSGYLRKVLVGNGGVALVGQAVAIFTEKLEESLEGYHPEGVAPEPKKEEEKAPQAAVIPGRKASQMAQVGFAPEPALKKVVRVTPLPGEVLASPLAKKLAEEKGLSLGSVVGSGPQGRVMSRDLDLAQPDLLAKFGCGEQPSLPGGSFEEEALTPMRKTIGERLQAAKTFIPHFYLTMPVNAAKLQEAREQLKNLGHKISVNDFVMRAVALALRAHPEVNSGFNSVEGKIIRFQTVDVACAVSVEAGLITPIVRHADYKNLGQISQEVKALAKRAKEGKLAKEEYTGGSFTVSNLGMYGVAEFMAILNPPQAAILAVGAILDVPVVESGAVRPGKVMQLTLSVDHRVIDGAQAAIFLQDVKRLLENPQNLVL